MKKLQYYMLKFNTFFQQHNNIQYSFLFSLRLIIFSSPFFVVVVMFVVLI